jgi:hypothetical protein
MKMAHFWVLASCSLVEVYERFKVLAASIIRMINTHHPDDDGGSKYL